MANPKKKARPKAKSQPEQSERFLRAAKDAEADETGKKFERAFKNVVRPRKHQSPRN